MLVTLLFRHMDKKALHHGGNFLPSEQYGCTGDFRVNVDSPPNRRLTLLIYWQVTIRRCISYWIYVSANYVGRIMTQEVSR
jgi:hypothetical protein